MTADLSDSSKIKFNEVVTGELLPELKEELEMSNESDDRTKRIGCILTLRNLLAFANEGMFKDMIKIMNETIFDKKITFDKMVALKIVNCVKTVSDESLNEVIYLFLFLN